ncbi:TDT family transporter [Kitasatospora sp. NPDC002227]|uniref:TDT family transporter n=1 Tax=Kitasatospora sp. NPDC002227 TaxID=3154773 RepID=UPI00332D30ED
MATITAPRTTSLTGFRLDLSQLGPNWYAAVMGTAITANGAAALPVQVPGLLGFAQAVWALSLGMLAVLVAARLVHFAKHREAARAMLLDNPATAVFYGCPPMAMLAVGYGTLAVGSSVIGTSAAVGIDLALWSAGTLYGLAVAVGIPYLLITRHRVSPLNANPTWLLPAVAPVVAGALGPALIPHLASDGAQVAMFYGCFALLGAGLLGTLLLLPIVLTGLVHSKLPSLILTPSLFLVLGPLGQSTTAVNQLADASRVAAPQLATATLDLAELYGIVVMGFALLWLGVALAANLRALRAEMPFAMTWWAFTFPVGTMVTGAAGLAKHTGVGAIGGLAVGLWVLLVLAWAVASVRTVAAVAGGRLLR